MFYQLSKFHYMFKINQTSTGNQNLFFGEAFIRLGVKVTKRTSKKAEPWSSQKPQAWMSSQASMAQAQSVQLSINRRGQMWICNLQFREVQCKIFIISQTVCLTGSGTISIHVKWLQISDAPLKQNESMNLKLF